MPDGKDIDFRDQLQSYIADPKMRRVMLTLLSGERYTVTRANEIVILERVVFIMLGSASESMFPFEAICNVDVIYFD